MTISAEARKYMDMRDDLSGSEEAFIGGVFEELYSIAKILEIKAATDDRAAELEAAIIKFIIESREG